MQHDAWFFVGIFAFIFLIWIATGGPTRPLAWSGPILPQPGQLGGGTYLGLPRAPFTIGSEEVRLPGSSAGGGSLEGGGSGFGRSDPSIPAIPGLTFGTPSPYRSIVTLSHYVSGAGSGTGEYLTLSVSSNADLPVDITGWRIVSEVSGSTSVIPRGTEVPTSGVVNEVQDIILAPGDRAIIASGYSPIGASFKENKCIGYFSTFQTFSPPLPQSCPAAKDELLTRYGSGYIRDVVCIDYVEKLSHCQVALSPPVSLSGSCQAFAVKYLNYNGCVDAHRNDSDFGSDTWRVYLGRTKPLFRTNREVVKLLDAKGNTVDAFSY